MYANLLHLQYSTGDRGLETGDVRQEKEDTRRQTGDGRPEMEDRRRQTEDKTQETEDRRRKTGDGKQGKGRQENHLLSSVSCLLSPISCLQKVQGGKCHENFVLTETMGV